MKPKIITIIISVYKNINALKIILKALKEQTILVDEIIISEDGQSQEMKKFLSTINNPQLVHLTQEDLGWRKNKALNKAIVKASGDYLIFIDGDVVPHPRFIEGHINSSSPKIIAVGKRCELGKKYSQKVYNEELTIKQISNNFIRWIIPLHQDKIHHYEDGIYSKLINNITSTRHIRHIIGCNFSCYKEDFLAINGFNEDFVLPSEGEDVDITWRFRGMGIKMKSCRYIANVYHLWHEKGFSNKEGEINRKIMHENMKNKVFVCFNGIKKTSGSLYAQEQ